ncbi:MAG: hypothetical protein U0871_18095 [Gemmataceae bacterium]
MAIRFVSKFTSAHVRESTSDGHRSPPNRHRAMMTRHVGVAAAISRSVSNTDTYAFRSAGRADAALTPANGSVAISFFLTAKAKIDRTRRMRRATVAGASSRSRRWARNPSAVSGDMERRSMVGV